MSKVITPVTNPRRYEGPSFHRKLSGSSGGGFREVKVTRAGVEFVADTSGAVTPSIVTSGVLN